MPWKNARGRPVLVWTTFASKDNHKKNHMTWHDGANIYLKPYWKVEYQLEGSCPGGNVTKQKIVRTRIMSALQGMSTIASRQSSLMNSPSIFSTCKVRGEHMRVEREADQLQKKWGFRCTRSGRSKGVHRLWIRMLINLDILLNRSLGGPDF